MAGGIEDIADVLGPAVAGQGLQGKAPLPQRAPVVGEEDTIAETNEEGRWRNERVLKGRVRSSVNVHNQWTFLRVA